MRIDLIYNESTPKRTNLLFYIFPVNVNANISYTETCKMYFKVFLGVMDKNDAFYGIAKFV